MAMQRRVARREVLLSAAVAAAGTACAGRAAARRDTVSLPDFRKRGDPDDSAALARAFATGSAVHAPAGRYVVSSNAQSQIPSGATLTGDGRDRTFFRRAPGANPFLLHCDSGSATPARNIRDIRFRDLTFEDDVAALGFAEFSYLVMLNGVSDALFERVGFRGFRGDGLHLGSSVTAATERHNIGVTVRDCVFDGVNANNRNALSVIDCDGLLVEDSQFLRCTRKGDGSFGAVDPFNPLTGLGAPGPIDLEPNADAFAVIRNVTIRRNHFAGGAGYAVSMLLPVNDRLTTAIDAITVEDNVIEDRYGAFQLYGYAGNQAATARRGYGISICGNEVRRCVKPFVIDGMRGVSVADNRFLDCAEHAEWGYRSTVARSALTGNLFERSGGAASWFGLWVRDTADVAIERNRFVDCGSPGKRNGVGVAFVTGTSRRLRFAGNSFTAPNGRMTQAVMRFREAAIDVASLTATGNTVGFATTAVADALRR